MFVIGGLIPQSSASGAVFNGDADVRNLDSLQIRVHIHQFFFLHSGRFKFRYSSAHTAGASM